MTSGVEQAPSVSDERFKSIFQSHDSGADAVAPDAGQPRDDAGRFAAKPPEAPGPPAPTAPQQESKPEQQPAPQPEDAQPRMVPLNEVLEERKKRKEAQARALQYEGQVKAYEQIAQNQNRAPQQQPQQYEPPDPALDPQGYAEHQEMRQFVQSRTQIANLSEVWATRQHGEEMVQKALEWASQDPRVKEYFAYQARDPYGELIDAYKRQAAVAEIGPDVGAYQKRVKDQMRAEVMAELKKGNPQPQFPGTLASATAAGTQGAAPLTAEAMAASMFDPNRKRR